MAVTYGAEIRGDLVAGAVKCRTVAGALALVPANAGRAGAVAGAAGSATIYLLGFREVASGCYELRYVLFGATYPALGVNSQPRGRPTYLPHRRYWPLRRPATYLPQ